MDANKLINRFFRKVDGVVWDLMSGKIGIVGEDGITTVDGVGDDAYTIVNLMDQFGIEIPAFAQSTPVESLNVGDLVINGSQIMGWIVEKLDNSNFVVLGKDGTRNDWRPPKVSMLGFDSGVMVLRSLINTSGGLSSVQNLLLPLMFMGGDGLDLDTMLPMILMMQNGTSTDTIQSMLPMVLMMGMMNKSGFKENPKRKNPYSSYEDEIEDLHAELREHIQVMNKNGSGFFKRPKY